METKLFNFNLPVELRKYLELVTKHKFTTISQYIIDLIVSDKNNNSSPIIKQIYNDKPITHETLEKLTGKHYSSGKKIKIGDHLLWGFLEEIENGTEILRLITFSLDEYGTIYQLSNNDTNVGDGLIPRLTKIKL